MFDVIKHYEKVSPELVAKFAEFEESASIHECMGRKNAFGGKVHPVWPGSRICGVAFTAEYVPEIMLFSIKRSQCLNQAMS